MDTQTYNYKVVRQFAIMTVVWGIVGMLVGVIVAAQLFAPALDFIQYRTLVPLRPPASSAHQCGYFCIRRLRFDRYIILRCSTYM